MHLYRYTKKYYEHQDNLLKQTNSMNYLPTKEEVESHFNKPSNTDEQEKAISFPDIKNINTQPYYNGNNSLYYIAEDLKLNAWEFDILKRIARCRFKGSFKKDLQKTKDVIDIYLKEYESKL